jgi:hypothetical protein
VSLYRSPHSFNIGSALLNAMTLCHLIKAIDDFNGKFGIGGVSDIFFLYGGVNQYARFLQNPSG